MQNQTAIILLGSNMGNRLYFINEAVKLLNDNVGKITNESKIYESAPWGFKSDNSFLNKVIVLKTTLSPKNLLEACLKTENILGRTRYDTTGYSSRKIDIDILYIGNTAINNKKLVIPHPRLHKRKFTLVPLVEILPEFIHPVFNKSQKELLRECKDSSEVIEFKEK